MMFSIERPLPGEFDGDVDPTHYGFGVIRSEPLNPAEIAARVGNFYARAIKTSGGLLHVPELDRHLRQPTTPLTEEDMV